MMRCTSRSERFVSVLYLPMRKLRRASSALKYSVGRMPGGIWSMKQNTQWLAHEWALSMR